MKIINAKGLVRFAASGHAEKEGYLLKRGDHNKSFQRRWFVLKGNLLFYYEKKGDKEPIGVIVLEGCTIEVADCEDVDNYAFQVTFPGSLTRNYILSADSQEELETWMRALSCAPFDYVKLLVAELQSQLQESPEEDADLDQATERDSNIVGRTYNEPHRPLHQKQGRVNPFNDLNDSSADDFDAFRDRTSSASFSLNIVTWQMLHISSFKEMHAEIGRQIKELNSSSSHSVNESESSALGNAASS